MKILFFFEKISHCVFPFFGLFRQTCTPLSGVVRFPMIHPLARVWGMFSAQICFSLACGAAHNEDLLARVDLPARGSGCVRPPPLTLVRWTATDIHPSKQVEFRVPAQRGRVVSLHVFFDMHNTDRQYIETPTHSTPKRVAQAQKVDRTRIEKPETPNPKP